jgi:3-hydroxybutyryl-CoA dehydrogenase
MVSKDCILATNTSSISVTSIAAACSLTSRVVGIHFFNPAHLMPLVEIVPGMATAPSTVETAVKLIKSWGKTTVKAKDTPGFIVNRVARPFYGEAIRIYEEGIADFATIDWAMKEIGGFKMGPFELMDFIGNDINYKVTETVWTQFFFDPRYKPSLTQKRLYEAGYWGRKKGRGYYDYSPGAPIPEPKKEKKLGEEIFLRILSMLINEAYEAWYYNIATRDELETAMTKGVNYPKGLIQWAEEIGVSKVADKLEQLQHTYNEDRYRPSLLLKKQARP